MQTFLPYPSFARSAAALDRGRLGKQRSEAKQLLRALLRDRPDALALLPVKPAPKRPRRARGWADHPAALMWSGHEGALAAYGAEVCREWRSRGYADTVLPQLEAVARLLADRPTGPGCSVPPRWLGAAPFHRAHRSNLLRKDPVYYSRHGWTEPPDLPYIWPTP